MINNEHQRLTKMCDSINDLSNFTTKQYTQGSLYKGQMVNGLRCGYGIYYYSNGNYYKGYWKDGKKDGEGVYYQCQPFYVYKGTWESGKNVGAGVYEYVSGFRRHVMWEYGKIIEEKFTYSQKDDIIPLEKYSQLDVQSKKNIDNTKDDAPYMNTRNKMKQNDDAPPYMNTRSKIKLL